MYLMTAFLGSDSKYMEPTIKAVIHRSLAQLLTELQAATSSSDGDGQSSPLTLLPPFNFEAKLEGNKSFESLYFVLVDVFQSSGYADELFSVLVMAPLAQRYDAKWRKRVWSEHVAVLRFITCNESQVSAVLRLIFN